MLQDDLSHERQRTCGFGRNLPTLQERMKTDCAAGKSEGGAARDKCQLAHHP